MKNKWHWYDYLYSWFFRYFWNFISDAFHYRIKNWWQRSFRGWGFADTWDLSYYFSKVISEAMEYQKKHQYGYCIWNSENTDEENQKLTNDSYNKVIYAFKLASQIECGDRELYLPALSVEKQKELCCLTKEENDRMKEGMKIFIDNFFMWWD